MSGPQIEAGQAAFEFELTRAIRRVEAPAGFADGVLARVAVDERPAARVIAMPQRWRTLSVWATGAVAATLLISLSSVTVHRQHERAEATRQFEVATQIEQQTLERTRERLLRSGIALER